MLRSMTMLPPLTSRRAGIRPSSTNTQCSGVTSRLRCGTPSPKAFARMRTGYASTSGREADRAELEERGAIGGQPIVELRVRHTGGQRHVDAVVDPAEGEAER